MTLQAKHYTMQIDSISKRQSQIIDGFLKSKDKIIQQTGEITAGMLDTIQKQTLNLELETTSEVQQSTPLLGVNEKIVLPVEDEVC